MGFGTGLISALGAGAEGYGQGELENRRLAIQRAIMKRKEDSDAQKEQLARDQFEEKKRQDMIANRLAGYTPASTTATLSPPDAPAPDGSAFDQAMAAAGAANGMPMTPKAGPLDGPAPVTLPKMSKLTIEDAPETFDPMAGTKGVLQTGREIAQDARQKERLDSAEARNQANIHSRELIARLRAANSAAGRNGTRPMTANAKERNARNAAKALLVIHGGSDGAKAWLASPDGLEARNQGITPFHIDLATGEQTEGDVKTSLSYGRTMAPDRAAQKVRDVRKAATAPPPADASAAATTGTPGTVAPTGQGPARSVGSPAATQPAPPPAPKAGPPRRDATGSTPATKTGLPPLTAAQIAAAQADPARRKFYVEKGYTIP